ncbi:MAG: nucleoside triphosphate pyrophosphohydrolase family protein [Planctomycetota bacterium]
MDFEEYQANAAKTDDLPDESALLVAFLGIGGEAGSLLTEYKKRLRDGSAHERFSAAVTEELGDILWYVSTVASRLHLDLSEIAITNLAKTADRWGDPDADDLAGLTPLMPDANYPAHERLPRQMRIRFEEASEGGRKIVRLFDESGSGVGNHLRDNAYEDDGYRYHDAMHLAHVALLGWSPVFRKLLQKKRKSNKMIDEIEDGGRAVVIEEAVVAFVYDYAKNHAFLDGVEKLDYNLLRTIKSLTSGLEVSRWSLKNWETAILDGFKVWRGLTRQRGGIVSYNLAERSIQLEV